MLNACEDSPKLAEAELLNFEDVAEFILEVIAPWELIRHIVDNTALARGVTVGWQMSNCRKHDFLLKQFYL